MDSAHPTNPTSCPREYAYPVVSVQVGLSFALESIRTALLLVQLEYPNAATSLQELSFQLSLAALAVPLVRFFYDAIIVNLISLHRGGKLDRKTVALQCLLLASTARSFALKFVGIQADADANTSVAGAVHAAKAIKAGSQEQHIVEVVDTVSAVAATVAQDVLATTQANATGPMDATESQSMLRAHPARLAGEIQPLLRPHPYTLRHEESAKKVQAAFRARDTRCKVHAHYAMDVHAIPSSPHSTVGGDSAAREAFLWLGRQEEEAEEKQEADTGADRGDGGDGGDGGGGGDG